MILGIITFIFSILGIYGFYSDNQILLTIASIMIIIEIIIGLLSGQLKSLLSSICASIIGIIVVKDFWIGLSIGLCYETFIVTILGYIMFAVVLIKSKK